MSQRDILSWNLILTAYFSNGESEKAFDLFHRMRIEWVKLNSASWNAVISGCMQNGRTEQALEFLTQCKIPDSNLIISQLPKGYCCLEHDDHGKLNARNGEEALLLFHKMIDSQIKPNSLLSRCFRDAYSLLELVQLPLCYALLLVYIVLYFLQLAVIQKLNRSKLGFLETRNGDDLRNREENRIISSSSRDSWTSRLRDDFGPTEFEDYAGALAKLRQIASVRSINRTDGLTDSFLISCFVCGLKEEIRLDVQMFHPTSLNAAIGLAQL
ncbi:hypothetical protein HHK36_012880 [Tetracentron sinense]|uniref:Pentatricopeptide repeat-containing protein n=1 Tax=Tetracentron sinense TaxID=13715 RepID=A0A835DJ45_TETSI|nr:hypothetical protein HHK36_012880 [Tetracentron sinense]